jgi:hypothetical protein
MAIELIWIVTIVALYNKSGGRPHQDYRFETIVFLLLLILWLRLSEPFQTRGHLLKLQYPLVNQRVDQLVPVALARQTPADNYGIETAPLRHKGWQPILIAYL